MILHEPSSQADLAAALDQLAAVYWRAGFPARR
jgi:hypothetical protein